MKTIPMVPLLLWGCAGTTPNTDTSDDTTTPVIPDGVAPFCANGETYAPDPVEPMTLGEVIYPYSWPVAVHRGSEQKAVLDLANVPCAVDPEIDWSPFDVLLFVSIPAW